MVLRLAILISGNGSNMLNIVESCIKKKINAEVGIVISNNPNSSGLRKLQEFDVNSKILRLDNFKNKGIYEQEISNLLVKENTDLVCLAGYMKILGPSFLKKWNKKIINIHPSLLPAFKGINAQQQALKYNVKYSGCTVHFVNEEIDGGDIIDQSIVRVDKNETVKSLKKKILIEEHKLYIKVLKSIIKKGVLNE